jgi:uncharacterized protein YycO
MSRAIRCVNWGPYSHASWLTADHTEIEAWRKGVTETPGIGANHTPGTVIDCFAVEGLTPYLQAEADAAMRAQLGRPYDLLGVLGFVIRNPRIQRDNALFCSELVFSGLDAIGIPPLKRIPACKVFPTLLSYSPRLTYIRTIRSAPAPSTPNV